MSTGVPVKARTLVWGDPGCAFAKNTDDEYKRKKDKWLHDYCCQACQKSSGKSHGVACQKVVRGKSQAKSSWEPDASSWKAGWKHSEEKEGEESSGSTWRKAASNSAPAAGEAVNDRGPRGKAAKESTFDFSSLAGKSTALLKPPYQVQADSKATTTSEAVGEKTKRSKISKI
jgi:hypothetical protein